MMTTESSNLHIFLIFTPLQALISQAIINHEKIENPVALAIKDGSSKVITYCDRIFNEKVITLELHRGILSAQTIMAIRKFINSNSSKHITLYTGSIKSTYSRYFIQKSKENITINTFDDGLGNLVLNGYFSQNDKLAKTLFLSILGVREPYLSTLKNINTHYTIYNMENVYDKYCKIKKIIHIDTSQYIENIKLPKEKIIRVLLTQPYSERGLISLDNELNSYKTAIKIFNISHILPHPSDSPEKLALLNAEKIETPYIAEDIISHISKSKEVEIYAFGSSALINTSTLKNVKCHWLKNTLIPQTSLPSDLFKNINIIELPDEKI